VLTALVKRDGQVTCVGDSGEIRPGPLYRVLELGVPVDTDEAVDLDQRLGGHTFGTANLYGLVHDVGARNIR
jgi:hypothetical protein